MGTQTLLMTDINGLTPGIDPRNSDKTFILESRNVVFDSLGPKSDFGNRYLTTYPVGRPQHTQGCRLKLSQGDRCFTFNGDGILEWDEDLGGWVTIYVTPDTTTQPYRWTYGYLNGIMYFCHPATGMLKLNLDSGICEKMYEDGVPSQALAMCVTNGRIGIIDEEWFTWSGPGNGLDYVPRLGGAGQQKIADRVSGDPIMVMSYQKGALVFTSGGVLRCEFTGDASVFHFRELNTEYRPINSFCLFKMDDDTVGFVDERGIFTTAGERPQAFSPIFNEFLINYLQRFNLKMLDNVRIEWDDLKKRLYLMTSLSLYDPLFESTFVLYPTVDKWGTFDTPCHGIVPLIRQDNAGTQDYFGFVDASGRVRYWLEAGSVEVMPSGVALDAVYPLIQKPATFEAGALGSVLSSSLTLNTVPVSEYEGIAGLYQPEAFAYPFTPVLGPLDAEISVGLLNLGPQDAHDRMVEVQNIYIGSAISANPNPTTEDWALIPSGTSDEDYAAETGGEDFGVEGANYVNHGLSLFGTNDGKRIWDSAEPMLIRFDRASRDYACNVAGLWHILQLRAEEVGQSFHIRHVRFTVTDGGKLL